MGELAPGGASSSTGHRWVNAFVRLNRRTCERLAGALPHTRVDVFARYDDTVAKLIAQRPAQLVVDVGAGHLCPYADQIASSTRPRIVGVDLSPQAMDGNTALDETRIADVTAEGLPFVESEVDIVTSRSVLEHLSDLERFVIESARVLKPGGYSIHLLSGGLAPFAIVNRVVPEALSQRALYALHPASRGAGGQRTSYDHCHYRPLLEMFRRNGHDPIDIYANFGSDYLYFFAPLFVLESLYLMTIQALRLKSLAVSYLVVARRARAFDRDVHEGAGPR